MAESRLLVLSEALAYFADKMGRREKGSMKREFPVAVGAKGDEIAFRIIA